MNKKTRRSLAFIILPLAMALGACEDDDDPIMMDEPTDIVQTAQDAGSFNTLLTALEVAGLTSALQGEGPFTVFAPTDEAFAALPEGTLDSLLQDKAKLAEILTYHVVAGKVMAEDVIQMTRVRTLQGQDLLIADANVVATDIEASNGVIHVIDSVLIPN
jgi:uncharacterized surface protein with fasciclin (FAS1) repeats